jgi:membrane protease YdiL (CAAX protease family)
MTSVPPPPTDAEPTAPSEAPDEAPVSAARQWAPWLAPAAIALGFGLFLVGSVFVGLGAAIAGSSLSHPTPAISLISDLVFDASFVVAAVYLANLRTRARAADFGFRRLAPRVGIASFFVAGIGYYVATAIYASIFRLPGHEKLPNELGVSKSTAALVGAAIFVCVIAPIAEEFFFRGFIFGSLRRWRLRLGDRDLGTWVAAIITGILFGLAHSGSASPRFLIPLGFLGFVLCMVRWRTGSLYPCMALHSVNNSLALGINQLAWNGWEILGLAAGSLLVIGAITAPLSSRDRRDWFTSRP